MAALPVIVAAFDREILGERVRSGLAQAPKNGKRLGQPATLAMHPDEIRKLRGSGRIKSEIVRRLNIGRTSLLPHPSLLRF